MSFLDDVLSCILVKTDEKFTFYFSEAFCTEYFKVSVARKSIIDTYTTEYKDMQQ